MSGQPEKDWSVAALLSLSTAELHARALMEDDAITRGVIHALLSASTSTGERLQLAEMIRNRKERPSE